MCTRAEAREARDRRTAAIDRFATLSATPLARAGGIKEVLRGVFPLAPAVPGDMTALLLRLNGPGPAGKP